MRALLLITLLLGTLTACGIKPGNVEPPPGAKDKVFPRTYPNPAGQ